MQRFIQLVAFSIVTWTVVASAHAAEEIRWKTDLESAMQEAEQLHRPLLLHFWTPECVPCRRLEQNVFNQPRVVETLQEFFVPVKINANEHPELAARYRINSVPKDVIVTASNSELHRLYTPQDPNQYVAQLSAVAFRAGTSRSALPPMEGRSAADPRASEMAGSAGKLPPRSGYSRYSDPSAMDSGYADSQPTSPGSRAEREAVAEPQEVINRFASRHQDRRPPDELPANSVAVSGDERPGSSRWGAWPGPESEVSPETARSPRTAQTTEPAATRPGSDVPAGNHENATADAPARGPMLANGGAQAAPARPAAPSALGLDGYCPVTLLRDNKWVAGDPRFGIKHRGRVYLFASQREQDVFYADPDEFSPVLAGLDPVHLTERGEAVEGARAHGVVYRKRVYLFQTEENLQRFWQDPEHFASPIRQAMETGDVERLFR